MKLTEHYDGHVLRLMKDAEQTYTWNKENWTDALSRSTDKPRMEHCEDQNGTVIYNRAVQGHSLGFFVIYNIVHVFYTQQKRIRARGTYECDT